MQTIKNLPFVQFEQQFIDLMRDNDYGILIADTGSGKTTLAPVSLFAGLGFKSLVCEPLVATVVETSSFIAKQFNFELGNEVGYSIGRGHKTGDFKTSLYSKQTSILYATDALGLIQTISESFKFDILILDEFHVGTLNQTILEGWAWDQLQKGTAPFKKILIMSATMDAEKLSARRNNAPILKIPGKQFPIKELEAGNSISEDAAKLVKEGHDVLIFVDGKSAIAEVIEELNTLHVNAYIFPYHSQLPIEERAKAFEFKNKPRVVVATNALETGVTLAPSPGRKLAVIDSGIEKRVELEFGSIEILKQYPIAISSGNQRKGRTGRTSEGIYIDHCSANPEERSAYPTPEILRTLLNKNVLRAIDKGFALEDLPLHVDIPRESIQEAYRSCIAMGALNEKKEITEIGRGILNYPCSLQGSRMLVEANRLGVMESGAKIVALFESEDFRARMNKYSFPIWTNYTKEKNCDLLALFDLFNRALEIGKEVKEIKQRNEMQEAMGLEPNKIGNVCRLHIRLKAAINPEEDYTQDEDDLRQKLRRVILSGMVDQLHQQNFGLFFSNNLIGRKIDNKSVIYNTIHQWVVGKPFSFEVKKEGYYGVKKFNMHLLIHAMKVEPIELVQLAPHLVTMKEENYETVKFKNYFFNGIKIFTEQMEMQNQ